MTVSFEDNKTTLMGASDLFGNFTWSYSASNDTLIGLEQYHDKDVEMTVSLDRVYPISGCYAYDHDDGWESYCNKFGTE